MTWSFQFKGFTKTENTLPVVRKKRVVLLRKRTEDRLNKELKNYVMLIIDSR
jgi:hypothetical protein